MAKSKCKYSVYDRYGTVTARTTTKKAAERALRKVAARSGGHVWAERICHTGTHRKRRVVAECMKGPRSCKKFRDKTRRFRHAGIRV